MSMPPTTLYKIQNKHKKAKLIIFDLDGTLTPSKSEMDEEMATLFEKLLTQKRVAVIGGGTFESFKKQFLDKLNSPAEYLANLFLFPTNAALFYRYADNFWQKIYSVDLKQDEKNTIIKKLKETIEKLGYVQPKKTYGDTIDDRGTEITFSFLGQEAPLDLKEEWRRGHYLEKIKFVESLESVLPEMEISAAGYTSIDITKKGINKAYGIRQVQKELAVSSKDTIFVGDAIYSGGNDYTALETKVDCISVKGPEDTKEILRSIIG